MWEVDGDEIDGTFVNLDEAPTSYGDKPIVVLNVAGEDRTVWLLETALRNKFADEVRKRQSEAFTVGERIVIRRGEMRQSGTGRTYRHFTVTFVDRPKRNAVQILGPAPTGPATASEENDGIPW
jgi:hypothetical protein